MTEKRFACTNRECTNTVSLRYTYEYGGLCPACTIKKMVDVRSRDKREADRHALDNPRS